MWEFFFGCKGFFSIKALLFLTSYLALKLLQKDRQMRLGAGEKDFDAVKGHDFFQNINWTDLYSRKIKPPYNPSVVGVTVTAWL